MRISQLVKNIHCQVLGPDLNVLGLNYDSRLVNSGEIFVAISGIRFDGHDYVKEAIAKGAIAVVVERTLNLPGNITQILVDNSRHALGIMAATYYNHPSRKLKIIGITGTNGKTSTAYLVKAILEEAGKKVGLIGTIQNLIGNRILPAVRTTPESLDLQKLLVQMVDNNIEYLVIEVSSHALELCRTSGLDFDLAVFTNLTQDHLDFHKSLSQYFGAKAKLFNRLRGKAAIINFDDEYGLAMAGESQAPVYSYGIHEHAQFFATDIMVETNGLSYCFNWPQGKINLHLNLTGKFNVYNSLAAGAVCIVEGININQVKVGLQSVKGIFGRFESIDLGQNFAVIVDYAHTPDSLANVLQTAISLSTNRVITIFGAGGDRDKGKRPLMGQVAAKLSDYVIITSDNPRSEEPISICRQIEQGILALGLKDIKYEIEVNRRTAIRRAIGIAKKGDVVIIAGKGHETYQEFSYGIETFDDRLEAKNALKELLG